VRRGHFSPLLRPEINPTPPKPHTKTPSFLADADLPSFSLLFLTFSTTVRSLFFSSGPLLVSSRIPRYRHLLRCSHRVSFYLSPPSRSAWVCLVLPPHRDLVFSSAVFLPSPFPPVVLVESFPSLENGTFAPSHRPFSLLPWHLPLPSGFYLERSPELPEFKRPSCGFCLLPVSNCLLSLYRSMPSYL